MHEEGDTFWYHKCPVNKKVTFLPIGMKCPDCVLNEMDCKQKAILQQERYKNEIEGKD